MLGDGDWVEGEPKWWWKYVFPAEIEFWSGILQQQGPIPDPWKRLSAAIMEGLVMVHGAAGVGDPQIRGRLYREGVTKVLAAAQALANAKEVGASA
ncbi:MAG TPA: hypothetical protein VH639_28915 [Bryobacteraceae bacterium]|jgi:hypothetical protein